MNRAHVIGMGRLGRHLARRLEALGVTVSRWNRSPVEGVPALEDWTAADGPDAVFLTVSDDAIGKVAGSMRDRLHQNTWLIHHAGSVSREILGEPGERTAVLWPPMTFQDDVEPDWKTVPLVVDTVHQPIRDWARSLTPICTDVDGNQRSELHLAAVLLGNLTAGWIGMVQEHLRDSGLDTEALTPLVRASLLKALDGAALDHVTGPATRNDRTTLTTQSALLDAKDTSGELALIHHILTNRILIHHGHDPLPPLQAATRRD